MFLSSIFSIFATRERKRERERERERERKRERGRDKERLAISVKRDLLSHVERER